jgi:carbon storage regulator CsrA
MILSQVFEFGSFWHTQEGTFMLVLSRKLGERIEAPQRGLAVAILAVKGKAVRLGISAPEDLTVYREEVGEQFGEEASPRNPRRPQDRRSTRTESAVPCRRPKGE